ncbi:MAG: hypothetical protein PHT76_14785 [Anaerostipes sp.]|nr:hypothetical protein [Anaerostipes sp.]
MFDKEKLIEDLTESVLPSQDVNILTDAIRELLKIREWTPCSEDQPKKTDKYLITAEFQDENRPIRFVSVELYIMGDGWIGYDETGIGRKVIAWMPCPKPYRKE